MRTRFQTETGSVYELDYSNKTWKRLSRTEMSGFIRTDGGEFYGDIDITVGHRAFIFGPPIVDGAEGRIVATSMVVLIEHEPYDELKDP